MKTTSSYFFQTFAAIVLAAVVFLVAKEVLPKKLFPEKVALLKNVMIDSLMLEAIEEAKDSLSNKNNNIPNAVDTFQNRKIIYEEKLGVTYQPEIFDVYKGFQYLVPYFEKLYQLETNQIGDVRIAYFGDSMTDGDLIVQDLRSNLQQQFGGEGVGFVSITSESAASRASITHQFSGNWKTQSYLNIKRPQRPFGINGHVFFAKDTLPTWVRYKANGVRYATQLNNPTLFYGSSNNQEGVITYKVGSDTIQKKLVPTNLLNTVQLSGNMKSLKVDFKHADSIPIYGFNFDNGKGVHIDNFSNRGNSGLPISMFNTNLMRQFHQKLDYDLIILHYGTNVLNYGTYNYDWYVKKMTTVVNHLKECFPGVTILVISTADKATKYDLEMKTDSAVVPLSLAQKKYALKTESGYFNLYRIMGGDGAMVKWVEEEPILAAKDYTHFNYKGAKKVAEMLTNYFDEGYKEYKELRKNRKPESIKKPSDSVKTKSTINNEH